MAPFNWFKRKNKPPSPEETAAPEEPVVESPAADAESDPEPAADEKLDWAKAAYQMIQKRKAESAAEESAAGESAAGEPVAEDSVTEAPIAEAPITEEPTAEAPVSQVEDSAAEVPVPEAAPAEPPITDPATEAIPTPSVGESEAALAEAAEPEAVDSDELEEGALDEAATDEAPPEAPPVEPALAAELAPPPTEPGGDAAPVSELNEPIEAAPTEAADEAATEAARPFWAQAEAERQERLKQLKATAIDDTPAEPEPDVSFDEDFVWSAGVLAAQGRRPDEVSLEEISWLTKLRQGLGKTRRSLVNQLRAVVGQGPLNDDAVMEIESLLLQADVGIDATDYIIEALQNKLREESLPPEAAIAYLKSILQEILDKPYQDGDYSPTFAPQPNSLNVWLLTGVNGAGKTTTIGKLAHLSRQSDYSCLIAAADTFRAAAVEQVKVWGARSGVEVIANPGQNTDPAAVVFDAIAAAQSRDINVLLVDTAGRLQNKKNLMDELSKIRRIIDKKANSATVESLLVLDATLGQNGLQQAKVFAEAAQLSGVVLTKLDGTAKGGVALAVVQQLGLPIRFVGAGEGIEDLRPFSSYEFVEALLSG